MADESTEALPAGSGAQEAAEAVDRNLVGDLATGFALGELSEEELQRLYNLLRQPGPVGTEVARIAWRVLGTTVDLRATIADRFQANVHQRLRDLVEPAQAAGFLDGVLARIGRHRPKLEAIPWPGGGGGRGRGVRANLLRLWPLILLPVLLVAVLIWLWPAGGVVVEVTGLSGRLRHHGEALSVGRQIGQGALVLPAGGRLDLRWPSGTSATLVGPGTCFIAGPTAVDCTAGRSRWQSGATAFTIGLPDRRWRLEAHSRAIIQVIDGSSEVAVERGRLAAIDGDLEVLAGEASLADGTTYALLDRPIATESGQTTVGQAGARTWRLTGVMRLAHRRSRFLLRDAHERCLQWDAEGVGLRSADGTVRRLAALPGPPLRDRALSLRQTPRGELRLRIAGFDQPLILPTLHLPLRLFFNDGASLAEGRFVTGPPAP